MFKYNELSDLLDGTLVTPLSKEGNGSIRCIDGNGNECYYEFDDFDFDKTIEERASSLEEQVSAIIDSSKGEEPEEEVSNETDNSEENETTQESSSSITVDELIEEMDKDDSIYDGTDDETETTIVEEDNEIVVEDERFLNSSEIKDVLNQFCIPKDNKTNIKIWRDVI